MGTVAQTFETRAGTQRWAGHGLPRGLLIAWRRQVVSVAGKALNLMPAEGDWEEGDQDRSWFVLDVSQRISSTIGVLLSRICRALKGGR